MILTTDEFMALADEVIHNFASRDELRAAVEQIVQELNHQTEFAQLMADLGAQNRERAERAELTVLEWRRAHNASEEERERAERERDDAIALLDAVIGEVGRTITPELRARIDAALKPSTASR